MSRDMGTGGDADKHWRWMWAAALAGLLTAGPAAAHSAQPALASVEVVDRSEGNVLPVYDKDGRHYIVGTPGHEYTVRVRNLSGERILAVTSVDGVNVVTGETAAPDQSGYVIDAWGSVEIQGWRKSLQRTAAFYFTDLGDSYAARTGRPGNVGVIGLAVFRERPRVAYGPPRDRIADAERDTGAAPAAPKAQDAPEQAAPAPSVRNEAREADVDARSDRAAKSLASPLGTGHGRSETSYATRVTFERASRTQAQIVSLQYDRRENLAAMGVLDEPHYARRAPEPFPARMGFVPDPR